jgi:hypothetical protein
MWCKTTQTRLSILRHSLRKSTRRNRDEQDAILDEFRPAVFGYDRINNGRPKLANLVNESKIYFS